MILFKMIRKAVLHRIINFRFMVNIFDRFMQLQPGVENEDEIKSVVKINMRQREGFFEKLSTFFLMFCQLSLNPAPYLKIL